MCERRSRLGSRRSLVRSTLGSLSEGAGSPNGLTEGVSWDEWWNVMVLDSQL